MAAPYRSSSIFELGGPTSVEDASAGLVSARHSGLRGASSDPSRVMCMEKNPKKGFFYAAIDTARDAALDAAFALREALRERHSERGNLREAV